MLGTTVNVNLLTVLIVVGILCGLAYLWSRFGRRR